MLEEWEQAYIDLRSVLQTYPSVIIPIASNTPATTIVSKQNKLQVIHLVLLTLTDHLCTPFCFHRFGPILCPSLHCLSINSRLAKHIPCVVGSGILKKESTASPKAVFPTVQSVRLRGRTGRTMARSPSFWGC